MACALPPHPKFSGEIHSCSDRNDRYEAAEAENSQMIRSDVLEQVDRPPQNVISCRSVFTLKTMLDNSVRPKARLVARGFNQDAGIDYYATFYTVAHMEFGRFLLVTTEALRSVHGLKPAPRRWRERFGQALKALRLVSTHVGACIFYRSSPLMIDECDFCMHSWTAGQLHS